MFGVGSSLVTQIGRVQSLCLIRTCLVTDGIVGLGFSSPGQHPQGAQDLPVQRGPVALDNFGDALVGHWRFTHGGSWPGRIELARQGPADPANRGTGKGGPGRTGLVFIAE